MKEYHGRVNEICSALAWDLGAMKAMCLKVLSLWQRKREDVNLGRVEDLENR